MERRVVTATRRQEARRRLAFAMDRREWYVPEWVEQALCLLVAGRHYPIWQMVAHHPQPTCAWCRGKVSPDSPDTLPRHPVRKD